jgi:hypothetical protein
LIISEIVSWTCFCAHPSLFVGVIEVITGWTLIDTIDLVRDKRRNAFFRANFGLIINFNKKLAI